MKIIKRDGTIVEFDKNKIEVAILKAMEDTNMIKPGIANNISLDIENEITDDYICIEEIQDLVENHLMKYGLSNVAKKYILYREKHKQIREERADLYTKTQKYIQEIMSLSNIENSNANVDEASFSGKNKRVTDYLLKEHALNHLIKPDIAKYHREGVLYQHDLDAYLDGRHNCLTIDFDDIFNNNGGFCTRNTDVRKPNSISSFFQLVAVVFQLQSQVQFGGVASGKIDFEAAPYVEITFKKCFKNALIDRYDYTLEESEYILKSFKNIIKLENECCKERFPDIYKIAERHTIHQTFQAAESLYHNLGTLESRQGSQVPFSSINFGLDVSPEGRLVSKALLSASIDGVGKHHSTPIFPISIFSHKDGVNAKKGDPNYDLKLLAIESLSKRIYPNFCNMDSPHLGNNTSNKDEIFATMGCRTMLGFDINGLGYEQGGRGNICPITLNLVELGIKHGICLGERENPNLEEFNKELEFMLQKQEEALLDRFEWIASQPAKSAAFMYENGIMKNTLGRKLKPDEEVRECVKHGSLAFGFIGIAEMCIALFGKHHGESEEVYKFAYDVIKKINEYANKCTEKHSLNFSCYATPAENLCHTLKNKLLDKYGIIKGITDKEYITNSFHIPVYHKISIKEKIDKEAPFTKLCTGGYINYVELESAVSKNLDALESIINYGMEQGVSYLAINFPIDNCYDCGFSYEIPDICPKCGSSNIKRLRRVTGYLSSDYRNFNNGKIAEVKDRIKHSKISKDI